MTKTIQGYKRRVLTGPQIRAARALLGWSTTDLAKRAGLALSTVQRADAAPDVPRVSAHSLAKIQAAIEEAGVIFLEVGDTRAGGRGGRLK
jgi:transcriptional regulator with XRE-family HTH domain